LRGKNVPLILSGIDTPMLLINRINENGTYRSPKQIVNAMGHDLETHLKSYSRFNTKDLENAFDSVIWKSEKKVEKFKN